jgi:hypothetical protein
LNRGLSVVDTYQILVGKPLEEEIYMKASILGWTVELVLSPAKKWRLILVASVLFGCGRYDGCLIYPKRPTMLV